MNKKLVLIFIAFLVIAVIIFLLIFRGQQKNSQSNPNSDLQKTTNRILPSETSIEYVDPSGFSFSYPDDLSLTKNETDDKTYADLQLSSSKVSGSLALKIADSKFKSLDEWVKLNKSASKDVPKEVKLGNLKGLEIRLSDRLLMGALDQGILFSLEMPLLEEEFWSQVYSKIVAEFSFAPPAQESSVTQGGSVSTDEVSFEGEEVVE